MHNWLTLVEKIRYIDPRIKEELAEAIDHGVLVSNLARLVAAELHETEDFVSKMAFAGLVHDIGRL